ncbi:MAG: sugar diacid utilization regulator [Clostridia bacterium]|jgi:sugar diacid utilization regulator|nr:sugar diacid utilization regulator [Clostridia bacterium]
MKTGICNELFIKSIEELALGRDIPYITGMLAEEIGKGVIITDSVNRVLAFHDPSGTGVAVGEFFPLNREGSGGNKAGAFEETGRFREGQWATDKGILNYVYLTIGVPGKLYGHCIVLCAGRELDTRQKMIIQQLSLTLLLALKESLDQEVIREQLLDEFTYDVLYNNYDSKVALFEKARRLKWNLEGPFAVVVMDVPTHKLSTARRLGPAVFNTSSPIYTVINENVVIILSLTNLSDVQIKTALKEFTTELLGNLAFNHVKDVHMGIGCVATNLTDLHQSFQEAKVALELGKVFSAGDISCFDEMGFLKFIFSAPAQELQEFVQRILGKIIAYDLEMETELLKTIEVYLNQHCQITNCAKALYIHENTLRSRLKKIEQLLGFDLKRIDHLLNIYIALQILKTDHYHEFE